MGAIAIAVMLAGCTSDANLFHGRDGDNTAGSQTISERGGEGNESGNEDSRGEHPGGTEGRDAEGGSDSAGGESGGNSQELNEAAMSSPIIPLDETWNGDLGPLAINARYDAAAQSVISTVQNTTSQKVCYVQAEPHLKSGTTTKGELGPDRLGDLNPGQTATTNVSVPSEPALAGVAFDGYVIHMEVFDCAGPGPQPHAPRQGGNGGAEGTGGEGHGPGGEGDSESTAVGEEGSATNQLAPDEIFDMVRSGARLIMNYDAASNSFKGTVENTTSGVLTRVRIEVHLSNGTELGPTTPIDLAPGQTVATELPSTAASFTGWVAHAEVGSGEGGGEHGSDGREGGGEGRGGG